MKSLEHIIRLIHEKKCECEKKKSSLENTIRKVQKEQKRDDIDASMSKVASFDKMATEGMEYMGSGTTSVEKLHTESGKKKNTDESVGVVGTDKYKGSQFTTRQTVTPVIKPGHNEQAEKASNARNIAKTVRSPSLHGTVSEGSKVETVVKGLEAAGLKSPMSLGQLVVVGKKELPAVIKKTKTQLPSVVKPETKTVTKTETPALTPVTNTEPKSNMIAKVAAALGVPAALVATKTTTDTKVATTPATGTKTATPVPPPPEGTKPKPRAFPVPLPKAPVPSAPDYDYMDVEHRHRSPSITHKAKYRRKDVVREDASSDRKKIQNIPRSDAGDRKSIEYVGREDADLKTIRSKTARNAELKNKIIDEGKKISALIKKVHKNAKKDAKEYREDGKTRVYPNVIVNPELNRVDLNTYVDSGKVPNDYK